MRIRTSLFALTLGVILVALPVAHATAGTITVTYMLAGVAVENNASFHVSPLAGTATFSMVASRATPLATAGTIFSITPVSPSGDRELSAEVFLCASRSG